MNNGDNGGVTKTKKDTTKQRINSTSINLTNNKRKYSNLIYLSVYSYLTILFCAFICLFRLLTIFIQIDI